MKKHRAGLLVIIGILILACNVPSAAPSAVSPTDTAEPTAAEAIDAATNTPTTAPSSATAAPPSAPAASPSTQAVNCRSGPGLGWDVLTLLQFGQSADIVGKTIDGTWLEVKLALLAGGLCWVSAGVVTVTGDLTGIQVVAVPPTPTGLPTSVGVTVTSVSISVSPSKISVGGCVGPLQPSTITASIWVNGPIKLRWHFHTEQKGDLPSHVLNFSKATGKDVSDTFTPILKAGTYDVELFIDGFSLEGMDTVATYKIEC